MKFLTLKQIEEKAFSLVELMVVLLIFGIVSASAYSNLNEVDSPLTNASFEVPHFLRLARSRAISQTLFIRVAPSSNFRISTSSSDSCTGIMTSIPDLFLNMPNDTRINSTTWSVCFTPRGIVSAATNFTISDQDSRAKTVEVALGGGVRIQ